MYFRLPPMPTSRWGLAASMGATAVALCTAFSSIHPAPDAAAPVAARPVAHVAHPASSSFSSGKWGDASADADSNSGQGNYAPGQDPGSLYTIEKAIGARSVWSKTDAAGRPVTGQGVGVALLDSGVTRAAGLDGVDKVTYGPDLSIEGNGALAQQDTFGHGTFMAGIIAGRGATNPSSDLPGAPASVQLGIAPDAKVLALKLATTDGSTDVSQVIAALDWVTQHPVMPDGTAIRVINLSFGTDSPQSYQSDPLAAAAENAWLHGIVVVTSAGNGGTATGRVTDPAIDPYVLAVGAADSANSMDGWSGDRTAAASFSNVSTTDRHSDLVAPGTSVVSLRDPGSFIDTNNPQGRVSGDSTGALFRGSGTSQAAAVVSGAVADLLQAFPTLTPDQVKYALVSSADPIKNANAAAVGSGIINMTRAFKAASHLAGAGRSSARLTAAAVQSFPQATGQGSIDAARGGSVLIDADGNELSGEVDAQGVPWDAAAWRKASSSLTAWSGGQWLGTTWTGDAWISDDTGLASARWSSARWSSARWSDAEWDSARWSSARWSSARWSLSPLVS